VIGPFNKDQLFELKTKGHIQGNEEAQLFPTGEWRPISEFDFYDSLNQLKSLVEETKNAKEETFVIDLAKLRNQQNEKDLEELDILEHPPQTKITETIHLKSNSQAGPVPLPTELQIEQSESAVWELEIENSNHDKTQINPQAQKEIEKLRQLQKEREEKEKQKKEEQEQIEKEKLERLQVQKIEPKDESTQIIKIGSLEKELLISAAEEEKKIEIEEKKIRKKKKDEEKEDQNETDDDDNEEVRKKKKLRLIILIASIAIGYAILFPDDGEPKKQPFVHLEPIIEFPVPFDSADARKSKVEFEKARELYASGDYVSIVKAGLLLKKSYENNIDDNEVLSLLVRNYSEQLRYAREDKLASAQVIFNLIQSKRPFLAKEPNGVIGLNLFYMAINKPEAAADVISKYLKLYPKNVTQDLFAVYLSSLLKLGRMDLATQFVSAIEKAHPKNRYSYDALIEYYKMNQENEKIENYMNEAITNFPNLVNFYLLKAEYRIKQRKLEEVSPLLAKAEELNLEKNELNRSKFLALKGLEFALKGDVKNATAFITKSLEIEESSDLRMMLADLKETEGDQAETNKLISESKALKLLNQAKDFFEKRNYELAMSYAARATDAHAGHIPSELFLAKVQLKLGLAKQGLKTLESLLQKYPEDKSINLALIDAYIETYKFNDAKTRIGVLSGSDFKNSFEFASINGRLYMRMGDSLQAISWFKNSMNMNPLNDKDIYYLVELLIKRANFDAARILINKCMELDPINPDYRIAYSKIIYEQQDDQAAIGYLLGLMDEFGENPKLLSEIAIFYYRAGKVKDFQAYREKLEKLPTKDKALYEFLIRAALIDERFDEIPVLVEGLLRIEPGELEAMMTAGRVLFENGKLVEAARWFKRIQDKMDTYPKVQYYIAKIKFLSKDYDGALKDVEADVKENGDNDADLTLIAQIYVEKGDLVQAESYFKKSQKINPRAYESLMGLADISTKRNNFDLALDLYKKAMREKSDEPLVHKKIGDVYRLLGQGGLAVESYKLYLEMNPEASDKAQIESYINLMQ
jgi:tetratricopeptide (TPR) repeat protein